MNHKELECSDDQIATISKCGVNVMVLNETVYIYEKTSHSLVPPEKWRPVIYHKNESTLKLNQFGIDSIEICSDALKTVSTPSTLSIIIAWVCFFFSILGGVLLIISICFYCLDPELQNTKSKSIRSLCIATFVSTVCFEIFSPLTTIESLCFATTLTTHYFFLATVFWNSIIAFDVWRTFAENVRLQRLQTRLNFTENLHRWYLLVAWGVPFLVILLSLALEFLTDLSIYSHEYQYYSLPDGSENLARGPDVCWIEDKVTKIWLFCVPIFVLSTFNQASFFVSFFVK